MIVDYIDSHRHRFGVEPICRVLSGHGVRIAPSGYYAYKNRDPSRRALRDAALEEVIEATFWDRDKGRGVYGARKLWPSYAATASPPTAGPTRRWWAAAPWSA